MGRNYFILGTSPKERDTKGTRDEVRRTRGWKPLLLEEHPFERGIGSMTNYE